MTPASLALVLLAATIHAGWNFLIKGSRDTLVFTWGLLLVGSILYLPLVALRIQAVGLPAEAAGFIGVTVVLNAAYFWALGRAYAVGDLSLVYPVARGTGLLLVPLVAALFLGERMAPTAAAGAALVLLGVYVLHLRGAGSADWLGPLRDVRGEAGRYAVLTGVTIAAYSVWDKRAMTQIDPLLYDYGMVAGCALLLGPVVLSSRRGRILAAWRQRPWAVVLAGALSPLTYLLVLTALTTSLVSYVVPAREFGIVVGALLGVLRLRESFGRQRLLGAAIVLAGIALIATG